jgi:hypothetical protein
VTCNTAQLQFETSAAGKRQGQGQRGLADLTSTG